MMKARLFFLSLLMLVFFSNESQAQYQALYNGNMERGYPQQEYANTPYYPVNFQKGEVSFKGYTYTDVDMRCDLYTGNLIIQSPVNGMSVYYQPDELDRIIMNGNEFLYMKKQEGAPSDGWYEKVTGDAEWTMYRYHAISNKAKEMKGSTSTYKFYTTQKLFLLKAGTWKSVTSVSSFAKNFPEKKNEIKNYAKQNGLRLNVENIEAWKLLATNLLMTN